MTLSSCFISVVIGKIKIKLGKYVDDKAALCVGILLHFGRSNKLHVKCSLVVTLKKVDVFPQSIHRKLNDFLDRT